MKNKTWAWILGAVLIVCLGLSVLLLLPGAPATQAEIRSEGKLLETVDLSIDRVITVETALGKNVITIRDGKIAVTEANCPDHYCMARGFCSNGLQIVCLPNKLEIRFVGPSDVDGAVG